MSRGKKKRLRDKRGRDLVRKRRRWKRREPEPPEYESPNVKTIRVICIDCGAHGTIKSDDEFELVKQVGCPRCKSNNITRVTD